MVEATPSKTKTNIQMVEHLTQTGRTQQTPLLCQTKPRQEFRYWTPRGCIMMNIECASRVYHVSTELGEKESGLRPIALLAFIHNERLFGVCHDRVQILPPLRQGAQEVTRFQEAPHADDARNSQANRRLVAHCVSNTRR